MVTPKNQVKVGGNALVNVSSETLARLEVLSRDAINLISSQDSVVLSQQIDNISAALVSYGLDPSGAGFDLYARYGLAKRVDVGYKYAFGAHAFDGMYQFLGPAGGDSARTDHDGWYGSAGVQYSWQKSDLPSKLYLDKLGPVLDFSAVRRDLLFPVVFSYAFGPEERYGHFAFGAAYQRSFIRYDFDPGRLYEYLPGGVQQVPAVSQKSSYGSIGFFVNGKIGYKHVYLLPAVSVYYQNYGRYTLPGGSVVSLKGVTVIPAMGLQLWFGKQR